jgi:hypothetical protein
MLTLVKHTAHQAQSIIKRLERIDTAWTIKLDLLPTIPRRRYPRSRDDKDRNVRLPAPRKPGRLTSFLYGRTR